MVMEARKREVLDGAVARLNEAGVHASLQVTATAEGPDAVITLSVDDREHVADVRALPVTTSVVPVIADALRRLPDGGRTLLVTEYVSASAAEQLREHGVHFADAVGNMYVKAPGILLWVIGRRPQRKPVTERPSRAFQRAGLQVIFGLLARPDLIRSPYREMARAVGVSLGSVPPVIEDLRQLGHITGREDHRSLQREEQLLTAWAESYGRLLRPKLLIDRFTTDDPSWWEKIDPSLFDAAWGGETAAALITGYLRPETITVYAESTPHRLILAGRLRRDPNGKVDIRRRFWQDVFPSSRPDVVPEHMIYADLLAAGDARTAETAEKIREDHLVRSHRP